MYAQLKIIPELCIGCRSCELACSLENEEIMASYGSRINVVSFIETLAHGMPYHLPLTCHQCTDASCVNVCPQGALERVVYRQNDNCRAEAVRLDPEKCNGCQRCVKACSFGQIRWIKGLKKIIKCELCNGEPACVEACPSGAIVFEPCQPFTARKKAFEIQAYQILKQ